MTQQKRESTTSCKVFASPTFHSNTRKPCNLFPKMLKDKQWSVWEYKSSCIPALHSPRAVPGQSKIVNQFCESLLCKQLMSTCSTPTASNTWAKHTASCWRAFTSLDNKVDMHPQIHERTVQDVVVGYMGFTYWIKTHQLHKNQDKSTYPAIIIIQLLCTLQLKVHHP